MTVPGGFDVSVPEFLFGPFIDYYLDQVKKNPGKFHPNFGVGR